MKDKPKLPKIIKCKDCIHYWKRKGKKEICTLEKGNKIVSPCVYFED